METKLQSILVVIVASFTSYLILVYSDQIVDNEIEAYFFKNNLEAVFLLLIGFFVSNLLLLFFSNQIFKLWLKKIVSWFLPVSIIFVWFGSGGNEFVSPDKTDMAIMMSYVLTSITLIFALIQRFYYRR